MENNRIRKHPILTPQHPSHSIQFTWRDQILQGLTTDTIASALIANNIHIFGHHPKDHSPQGIFCANGQCAQCTVMVNGRPMKACMTPLKAGMKIDPMDHLPDISTNSESVLSSFSEIHTITTDVLIIGAGPAGLAAAIYLGQHSINTLLIDDKHLLGGKLVLQTHRFFGYAQEVYAGKRGIEISRILSDEVQKLPSVTIRKQTRAVAVFSDQKVGIIDQDNHYALVKPSYLLVATGARENTLIFPGNTLPGVYTAGAFQTLLNRDLVKPAQRLFVVGGGNVGLITAYHALQAGIEVAGLIEAMPKCGGYLVHEQKLARLGVPILPSHTILAANGDDHVQSITFAACDSTFKPVPGTERTIACDGILIAVGLSPVNEFYVKAEAFGMQVYSAGDAAEIAEASSAMISGKLAAIQIAGSMGHHITDNVEKLETLAATLRSRPGEVTSHGFEVEYPVIQPIIHCNQEIPCNPCTESCPLHNIQITSNSITGTPHYRTDQEICLNCERCLAVCPGLAITIVDTTASNEYALVSIPYEFDEDSIGDFVTVTDESGNKLADLEVVSVKSPKNRSHTRTVKVKAPITMAQSIAGILLQQSNYVETGALPYTQPIADDAIICRCERVTAGEIRALIRSGITDINQIKALTRAGMGACGSKTCHTQIQRLLREAGVSMENVTKNTDRPLFYEVELSTLANTVNTNNEAETKF